VHARHQRTCVDRRIIRCRNASKQKDVLLQLQMPSCRVVSIPHTKNFARLQNELSIEVLAPGLAERPIGTTSADVHLKVRKCRMQLSGFRICFCHRPCDCQRKCRMGEAKFKSSLSNCDLRLVSSNLKQCMMTEVRFRNTI
jgi:hypothetical protein